MAPRHRSGSSRLLLLSTAVVAVLALTGAAAVTLQDTRDDSGCDGARPSVHVAAAPEIADVVRGVANGLSTKERGCLRFTVLAQEPSALITSLADGAVRPPDVWVPDSSLWLSRAGNERVARASRATSVATSPLVLAVSARTATLVAGNHRPEVDDLVSAASTARGLIVQLSQQRLSPARVGAIVALQHATSSRPDSRAALTALLRGARVVVQQSPDGAPGPDVAVPVPEQTVWKSSASSSPLVAVYPGGASYDYPFVVLSQDDRARKDAGSLLAALLAPDGQARVRTAGFRDVSGAPGAALTPGHGVDPTRSPDLASLDDRSLTQAERTLEAVRMDARLLAVIDVSGSMARPVPAAGPGATRFGLAREAAVAGLSLYPDSTDVGLWVFSQALEGQTDYRELVPISPLSTPEARAHLAAALAATSPIPDGNTALYDTTLAAVRAVRSGWAPGRVNVVVLLSDGENTDRAGLTLDQLLATLQAEGDPARPVPVITIAYGPESDASSLAKISAATGGASYTSRDPAQIRQVFLDAVGQRACRPSCAPAPAASS